MANAFWFFSSSREFSVLESILAKAAFVKTVNGPSACKAPTKPAAFNAVTKVEKSSFQRQHLLLSLAR
jgi:hypothetical protein